MSHRSKLSKTGLYLITTIIIFVSCHFAHESIVNAAQPMVVAGIGHTVGLKSNGTVVAVGDNQSGQCNVGDWTDVIQVAAGSRHTVGLKFDGTVLAVGENSDGQLDVNTWYNIVQLTAGGSMDIGDGHTVGLITDGTVVAVGDNDYGQLNINTWANIVEVTAGSRHTVGLNSDGTVRAVGDNSHDQCDVGSWIDIVHIATGERHTVGLKSDGTVVGVGDTDYGKLNINSWTNIIQVGAGGRHTVGLMSDGTVLAVGDNSYGQCDVGSWIDIVHVAVGGKHTVGLKSDGDLVAAGSSEYGQSSFHTWADIVEVAGGSNYTIGLKSDGTAVGVGGNGLGQINVDNWSDIVQIAASYYHTVGLKSDGTVVAVGENYGKLDVGSWANIVQVAAGFNHTVGVKSDGTVLVAGHSSNASFWTDVVQAAAGEDHVVGVKSDATVLAVGLNNSGQCDVGSWTDIVQVAAGYRHTVGLKSDGTVVAVGNNSDGQCDVGGWSDIVQIAAGIFHTAGLRSDGTVVAVGEGDTSGGRCDVSTWSDIIQIAAFWANTVGVQSDSSLKGTGVNYLSQLNFFDWNLGYLDEPSVFSVVIQTTADEADNVLAGKGEVSISETFGFDLKISLNSSDTTEVTVPIFVIIPAGQTSANFDLKIVDDTVFDGIQTVTITASFVGWTPTTDTIDVEDNEQHILSLSLPTPGNEGDVIVQGTVSIPGTLASDLVVNLSSDDTSEVSVPASVTIVAGQTSANFDLTIVNDGFTDGAQTVTVSATASNWTSANDTLVVRDYYEIAYSQTKTVGSASWDVGKTVIVDSDGNLYLTGFFSDIVDFDPGPGTDIHSSGEAMFLTKFNWDGSYSWTKITDGPWSQGRSAAVDDSGNIYVTGFFTGTSDFDAYGAGDSRTSAGAKDIFLLKINADGSYGWAKTIGSTGQDYGASTAVNYNGDVYFAGYYSGTVDFNPEGSGDSHTSIGDQNTFLTKINADGSYGWTRTTAAVDAQGMSLTVSVDGTGNIYVAGYFSGTVDFDPDGPGDSHTSAGLGDIFLTKINSDESYGWTKTVGGTEDDGRFSSVAINDNGSVYVTGSFTGAVDFDPDGAGDNRISSGSADIFLMKINADGSYGWTRTMGGTGVDISAAIAVRKNDAIFVTGAFQDTVDFDPDGIGDIHAAAGDFDIFCTKFYADGSYGWTETVGGSAFEAGQSIAVDKSGNIWMTGSFFGTADFNPGADTDYITSAGAEDIFLLNFKGPGFEVSPLSLTTGEDGTAASTTVKLSVAPIANVNISVESSNPGEGTVDKTSITLTDQNWNTGQVLTVTGVDDLLADGNQEYSIVLEVTSAPDSDYNELDLYEVPATNMDDESATFVISPISGDTAEDGSQATFMVRLANEPPGNVVILVSSSDTGEGEVDEASLTFTNLNWNLDQTVTVTGVDDSIADGNQEFSIVLGIITSTTAGGYYNIDPPDLVITNIDIGEPADFVISSISNDTTEDGVYATFTVRLSNEPPGDVVIPVSSSDSSEGEVDKPSLTFTNLNWNVDQTITVTGIDDGMIDGDQIYSVILHTITTSTAGSYYNSSFAPIAGT